MRESEGVTPEVQFDCLGMQWLQLEGLPGPPLSGMIRRILLHEGRCYIKIPYHSRCRMACITPSDLVISFPMLLMQQYARGSNEPHDLL